jgi:hypothetical protein
MAAISNGSAQQGVSVNLGADRVWLPYFDIDTVRTLKVRIAQRIAFPAHQLELYAHYQPTQWWHYCCGDMSQELDDPDVLLKDLVQNVSHISVKVFVNFGPDCGL